MKKMLISNELLQKLCPVFFCVAKNTIIIIKRTTGKLLKNLKDKSGTLIRKYKEITDLRMCNLELFKTFLNQLKWN